MKNIIVACPQCREVLEIEVATGRIVKHHPEIKARPGEDFLTERMKSLKEERAQREALVQGSRAREKERADRYDELFRKVRETVKEEPVIDRPLRDVDID